MFTNVGSWMLFVDGENFTCRAQELSGSVLRESDHHMRDCFVWFAEKHAFEPLCFNDYPLDISGYALRSFYYTSVQGSDEKQAQAIGALHKIGFQPYVFRKHGNQRRPKGVDIALATDFLANAFDKNSDVAVLVAGDGDYVPMVNEAKRRGRAVYVVFFRSGLDERLRLAADVFVDIEYEFRRGWQQLADRIEAKVRQSNE